MVTAEYTGRYEQDRERNIRQLAAVVRELQAGDSSHFGQVVDMTQKMVFFNLRTHGVPERDVEDAAQDVYLKFYSSVSALQQPERAYGWLKTIAVNTAKNYAGSAYQRYETTLPGGAEEADGGRDPWEQIPSEQILMQPLPMPEDVVEDRETQRLMRQILRELPEKQFRLIADYYYNERSVREIAADTGMSESNVKVTLLRARRAVEEKVRRLEKEKGIRLHSLALFSPVSVLGFLILLETDGFVPDPAVTAAIKRACFSGVRTAAPRIAGETAGNAGSAGRPGGHTGRTAEQAGKAAGRAGKAAGAAGKTAARTAGGAAAKSAAGGIGVRAAAIVAAAAVAAGGGTYAVMRTVTDRREQRIEREAPAEADLPAADSPAAMPETERPGTTPAPAVLTPEADRPAPTEQAVSETEKPAPTPAAEEEVPAGAPALRTVVLDDLRLPFREFSERLKSAGVYDGESMHAGEFRDRLPGSDILFVYRRISEYDSLPPDDARPVFLSGPLGEMVDGLSGETPTDAFAAALLIPDEEGYAPYAEVETDDYGRPVVVIRFSTAYAGDHFGGEIRIDPGDGDGSAVSPDMTAVVEVTAG